MLRRMSQRDDEFFYTPSPTLTPAEPRRVDYFETVESLDEVSGGVVLYGRTVGGLSASMTIRALEGGRTIRCTLRAADAPVAPRLQVARERDVGDVTVSIRDGSCELVTRYLTVRVELERFNLCVHDDHFELRHDRETTDVSDHLVALPLGFTRLADGGFAYHATFEADPTESFYGFGEKFTAFDKRGQLICCWNQDALGVLSEHSYKNVPFFVSSRGYGVFVDTTTAAHFDMCNGNLASWTVLVPDEELDFYVFAGSAAACLQEYQSVVGGPSLLPKWAFGPWISSGFSRADSASVCDRAREIVGREFPCTVYHLDTYWQRFGAWSDMQWDREAFADPEAMLESIRRSGLRVSLWMNPYIGVESPLFAEAKARGFFLNGTDGSPWIGALWGSFHPDVAVIDVTNPEAVDWWTAIIKARLREGVDALKTDFGEAIPLETKAHNGMTGDRLHNAYALLYNDVVATAMEDVGQPAVLWGRASWAGGQRHAVKWGGDCNSTWQDLASTLRAGLSMAMSGHSFWSHDIGGFHGEPTQELYIRWAQFGLLSPLSRFHGTTSRLPWDFGDEAFTYVKRVAELRMRLLPYLYSAAWDAVENGLPMMRPMVLAYPETPEARLADLQYLIGDHLLVAPIFRNDSHRAVWFPGGGWIHYATGEHLVGPGWRDVTVPLEFAPLWVRDGAVVPMLAEPRLAEGDRYGDLILVVAGSNGTHGESICGRIAGTDSGAMAYAVTRVRNTFHVTTDSETHELSVRQLRKDASGFEPARAAKVNGADVPFEVITAL